MKVPIGICFSDLHLHRDNIEIVSDIVDQIINQCKEFKVNRVFCLGDGFESRNAQPLKVLNEFGSIISKFKNSDIILYFIPGNHDKVDYESEDSYLDEFFYHPSFKLYKWYDFFEIDDVIVHFIPYFKEETIYSRYFKECVHKLRTFKDKKHFLFTHVGIDGVKNNDGVIVGGLNKKLFDMFDLVFIGHYHNRSKVTDNIFYIGSTHPTDYSEDNEKGVTILYDDGSFDFVKLKFKEYHTIKIDLSELNTNQIDKLHQEYNNSSQNIKFKFIGTSSEIKSIDQDKFKISGIDVEVESKELVENINLVEKREIIRFNKQDLKEEFPKFCEQNNIKDIELGQEYLNKILK